MQVTSSSYLKYIFDKHNMRAERCRNGMYKVSSLKDNINYSSTEQSISVAILRLCWLLDTRAEGISDKVI